MPLPVDNSLPKNFPNPAYLTLGNFKRGVITVINESKVPKNALVEARNLFLVEDGQPSVRPGIDWFGIASPNTEPIDGFDYFDASGTVHLVIVAGGTVYRSLDDGASWTACTGATLTADNWVEMNQNGSYLYLTNGVNNIVRYDGTTTLQVYTALTTPSAPTGSITGTGTTYSYYYKIAAVNNVGFSAASTKLTIQHGTPRSAWDSTTNNAILTLPAYQTDQTRYDIYFSEDDINYFYLSSVTKPNLTWKDNGTAVPVVSTLAPSGNTTQGPKVKRLRNVGVRQYGVGDPNNKYRIWFTGAGAYAGSFSSAYDGGYLDWQPGGKLYPIEVADYKDGRGNNIATIWCDSADGRGGIIQMSLNSVTIGTVTITVPSAYQLPGSRGTPAPGSVVNVLNDYLYYNSQAIYNLGPRTQLNNFLSTDEYSADIRPSVKQINKVGEQDIASEYFDANVYISVPVASTTNNRTMIFNTEMRAWLPEAFTIGFQKFLRYTDQNRSQHLLCLKPGDNRLSEISSGIQGDYGEPFETSLLTGLYQTTKDRFEFQFTEEAEFEFSDPQDIIYVEILGIDRPVGFRSQKTVALNVRADVTNTGWDTHEWDSVVWDDTSVVPQTFSESSVPRYTTLQKELRAVQWHIYTNTLAAKYILRTLQTWGTDTQAGHPAYWRLNGI